MVIAHQPFKAGCFLVCPLSNNAILAITQTAVYC